MNLIICDFLFFFGSGVLLITSSRSVCRFLEEFPLTGGMSYLPACVEIVLMLYKHGWLGFGTRHLATAVEKNNFPVGPVRTTH